MKRIGEVWRIGAGTIVVRSPDDSYPAVGVDVITESLDTIGEVVDVMGPVERPFIVVSPAAEDPSPSLLQEPVYAR